jgi:Integrase core domain
VCTENLVRFDLMTETLNVGRNGRADILPLEPGRLVLQAQNGFVERLIGTIRRECVDHIVALGEQRLRRFVKSYASYYNTARTHRSLAQDAPVSRPSSADWTHCVECPGRRVASSIRPNLSFRYTQHPSGCAARTF